MTKEQTEARNWIEQNPLRRWRKAQGETLMGAASRLGVSMMTVQLWENGGMRPNDANMANIAALIGRGETESCWDGWLSQRVQ